MNAAHRFGHWTNPSVLAFAAGADPLAAASEAASQLLAQARELGLAGPPLDILALVQARDIILRPVNEVADAQIDPEESSDDSELVISYNPSRPRGRLRFSIAHELAHAMFPDVGEQIRRRTPLGAVAAEGTDDWELELICNLIASDLLMPAEEMSGLANTGTDIDFLMEFRRRWDVSTEAILRRYASLADRSIALVAGTRLGPDAIRVDYVAPSSRVSPDEPLARLTHGDFLGGASTLSGIVAVGQTSRGDISIDGTVYNAQAVGAPAYPGSQRARVLALLEPEASDPTTSVEHVLGDLTDTEDQTVLYVQVSSDSVRAWSRMGVGARLASKYPDFASSYRMWTLSDPTHLQLGSVHIVERQDGDRKVGVATIVAQEGFGVGKGQLRYDALAEALVKVRREALRSGAIVHVPRLGAGQAGGRWDIIEGLLDQELASHGIRVVVHTKPHQGGPQ